LYAVSEKSVGTNIFFVSMAFTFKGEDMIGSKIYHQTTSVSLFS
jgi:hypothetical protein